MKVLFAAAEASPLAKVGGLADVVGSLPKALVKLGHDVRIIIPRYGAVDLKPYSIDSAGDFKVAMSGKMVTARLKIATLNDGLKTYLVENQSYFGDDNIYGRHDLERFLLFSKVILTALPQLEWQPEIVHCHDWHTSLLPMWLKKTLKGYASVFTIHNLAYQGAIDEAFLKKFDLISDFAASLPGAPKSPLSFMSRGILWANAVTTVSHTYAREVLTPSYGVGLDPVLRFRKASFSGIVNGIDETEYNPKADPYVPYPYDPLTLDQKAGNKLALQEKVGLTADIRVPLIGMVQRLDEQKGMDILEKAIGPILRKTKTQLVILGRGRENYEKMLRDMASRYPVQVFVCLEFDDPLSHLIYAGCDMFLMPSRFEPCGLGQLIAMRYGALPIVHHTGGLVDTVPELSADMKTGNGFVFREYTPDDLIGAVSKALNAFKDKQSWHQAARRVMRLDFSWPKSAGEYAAIYEKVLGNSNVKN